MKQIFLPPVITSSRGIAALWVVVVMAVLTTAGAGAAGYLFAHNQAQAQLKEKDGSIEFLKERSNTAENQLQKRQAVTPSASPHAAQLPLNQTTFQSTNLGFKVAVPKEWVDQWKYHENGAVGVSTASVTFYLINKQTQFAEVATIGKIPQAKYDSAKASGDKLGNPDNLIGTAGGFVYVVTFPDNASDYKNFTAAEAVRAARASFKSSFKTL